MTRRTIVILTILAAVYAAPRIPRQAPKPEPEAPQPSAAQAPPPKDPPPVDKSVDLDGDGALSLAEVQYAAFVHHGLSGSVVEGLFKEVDKNKDGYLTSLEFNDIKPLVLAKAENAALRYMQTVDLDHDSQLSLEEAQAYILKEHGISNRDVERVWHLVIPNSNVKMDAVMFSKLRRRIRGMTIRLARQIMKTSDTNEDGHIDLKEAQQVAFEQEGIGAGDVREMLASVDDNNDNELNAPEFADFERIIRARAVDTSKKALKVVDRDGSGTLTMDEAKRIAFDHYGFNEKVLAPFFNQADENEDGQLDAVEFAGFRSVIRNNAVKNALDAMPEIDADGDGLVSSSEAVAMARRQDDMDAKETFNLFNVADQDKNARLDKVELADFLRLVRLSSIKFATDHFREFDTNKDKVVTLDELEDVIEQKYKVDRANIRLFFNKVDADTSGDLNPGEIVDFRHEVRRYVTERDAQKALEQMAHGSQGEGEVEAREGHLDENAEHFLIGSIEKKPLHEIKSRLHVQSTTSKPKTEPMRSRMMPPPKRKLPQTVQTTTEATTQEPAEVTDSFPTESTSEATKDDNEGESTVFDLSPDTITKAETAIEDEIKAGSVAEMETDSETETGTGNDTEVATTFPIEIVTATGAETATETSTETETAAKTETELDVEAGTKNGTQTKADENEETLESDASEKVSTSEPAAEESTSDATPAAEEKPSEPSEKADDVSTPEAPFVEPEDVDGEGAGATTEAPINEGTTSDQQSTTGEANGETEPKEDEAPKEEKAVEEITPEPPVEELAPETAAEQGSTAAPGNATEEIQEGGKVEELINEEEQKADEVKTEDAEQKDETEQEGKEGEATSPEPTESDAEPSEITEPPTTPRAQIKTKKVNQKN